MITAGVDLASQDRNTALCVVRWDEGRAIVDDVTVGVSNAGILAAADVADVVGLDAPLGWPDRFREAVAQWAADDRWPEPWDADTVRTLRLRATDLAVQHLTGKWPLSVSADSIAVCAMRAAAILTAAHDEGESIDRVGGPWFETYPGAALIAWGRRAAATGYKRDADVRERLLAGIEEELPALEVHATTRRDLVASDHAFDALLCALIARAAATGRTHTAGPDDASTPEQLAREGWIHVPQAGSLAGLAVTR